MQVGLSLKTVNYKRVLVRKNNLLLKSNQGSKKKTSKQEISEAINCLNRMLLYFFSITFKSPISAKKFFFAIFENN